MGTCLPRADVTLSKPGRTALVGMGNPAHGDDGIGPVVARQVYGLLPNKADIDLLEHAASGFSLAERLVGFERAVIIDALVDAREEVGTVARVEFADESGGSLLGFHTAGFHDILALARTLGFEVPSSIVAFGVVIREPQTFSENLSAELTARLPQIVNAVLAEVLQMYGTAES